MLGQLVNTQMPTLSYTTACGATNPWNACPGGAVIGPNGVLGVCGSCGGPIGAASRCGPCGCGYASVNGQCVSNLNLLTTTVPGALNVGATLQTGAPQFVATTTKQYLPIFLIGSGLLLVLLLAR